MGILGDSIDRGSSRRVFSINDQINSLGEGFGDYSRSFIEDQTRAIEDMYNELERASRDEIQSTMRTRSEEMRRSLEQWKSYSDEIRDNLTVTERLATDLFYWNRRRDLRNLEREARYRFDDIAEDAEDMTESLESMFSNISSTLREWGNALNLNSIANGLSDTTSSMRDVRIELQKYMDMSDKKWKELREYANGFSEETDYAISNLEYLQNYKTIVVDMHIDDEQLARDYARITAKFDDMTGVAAEQLESVFDISKYLDDPNYLRSVTSSMMAIQRSTGLKTNASDLVSAYDTNADMFKSLANGNKDLLSTYMEQSLALTTAQNAGEFSGLTDKLYEIMSAETLDLIQDQGMTMLGGVQIQQLMRQGKFQEAAELLMTNVEKFSSYDRNVLSQLGIDANSDWWSSIVSQGNKSEFISAYSEAMDIMNKQTNAAEKFVDTYTPEATQLEKLGNKFKTSALGSLIDDIQNELDITLAEGMLIASGIIDVAQLLFKGIKGIGRIFGLGGGASAAGGVGRTILGFSSGGAGVINHTFLGSTGNAMVAGTGVLGGISNLGTSLVAVGGGGAVSGGAALAAGAGSIAGGILGGGAVISGISDIAASSTEYTWQQEADKVTEGAIKIGGTAAAAGVGAAIGSIVPGVGTAVGALVGAGVGGLATLIWGDDWAQQLTDSLDGTKSVKKAIETIQTNSEDLSIAIQKDQSIDMLMGKYTDLREQMGLVGEDTDEYKRLQEELYGVVSDINEIYPGLVDLNTQDYDLMDKQVQVTSKLADAELALYKARVLSSGDEVAEGVTEAQEQYNKSLEKYDEQLGNVDELTDYTNFMNDLLAGISTGKWSIDGNSFKQGSASDEEWNSLLSQADKYLDIANDHADWLDTWVHLEGQGDETDLYGAYNVWNKSKDYVMDELNGMNEATADLAEKESTMISMLTQQMATYEMMRSADSWEDVARNWSTADVSDKAMLMQIGKLYSSVNYKFRDYLPNIPNLEISAQYDLNEDGSIGPKYGEYARRGSGVPFDDGTTTHTSSGYEHSGSRKLIGLPYVPFDDYPALLHKGETILTADEAVAYRNANNAGWTPNESVELLTRLVNISQTEYDENEDDSSNDDIVDTIKWAVKELTTAIESSRGGNASASDVTAIFTRALRSSRSSGLFSFLPTGNTFTTV